MNRPKRLQLIHTQRSVKGSASLARHLIRVLRRLRGRQKRGEMVFPLATLVALDEGTDGSELIRALEDAGSQVTTSSSGAWALLGRLCPDLLVLDPACGGAPPETWRRAVEHHRRSRALCLLVVSPSASIRALFSSAADLGVHERLPSPEHLLEILDGREEETESMREAS